MTERRSAAPHAGAYFPATHPIIVRSSSSATSRKPRSRRRGRSKPRNRMSDKSMRAAVLSGAGQVRIDRVPLPEPGPGQVRIRLEGCGVCASNLTPWAGPEWMRFPTEAGALGHEGWGVVDAVGEGVSALKSGDRVAALSFKAYAEYDLA